MQTLPRKKTNKQTNKQKTHTQQILVDWGNIPSHTVWASLVAQLVKNPPAMQESPIQFPGREDPLEKEMETHSSILAWEIPWTEEPGRLPSMGLQRVRCWLSGWAQVNVSTIAFYSRLSWSWQILSLRGSWFQKNIFTFKKKGTLFIHSLNVY